MFFLFEPAFLTAFFFRISKCFCYTEKISETSTISICSWKILNCFLLASAHFFKKRTSSWFQLHLEGKQKSSLSKSFFVQKKSSKICKSKVGCKINAPSFPISKMQNVLSAMSYKSNVLKIGKQALQNIESGSTPIKLS